MAPESIHIQSKPLLSDRQPHPFQNPPTSANQPCRLYIFSLPDPEIGGTVNPSPSAHLRSHADALLKTTRCQNEAFLTAADFAFDLCTSHLHHTNPAQRHTRRSRHAHAPGPP